MFRLAHNHAATIQSCRENSSPSMHAIFRDVPEEPLQTWVHLDGHGSQTAGSRIVHFGEFIFHKATLQNNNQDRMFENLRHSLSSPLQNQARFRRLPILCRSVDANASGFSLPRRSPGCSLIPPRSFRQPRCSYSIRAMFGAKAPMDSPTIWLPPSRRGW